MKNKILIKTSFFLLVLFFASQIVFSQTKVDEYSLASSDAESSHIDALLFLLNQNQETKGLIVIYSGENKERLGNILAHIEGIKSWIKLRGFDVNRVSFVITEGKETLVKELWIAKKGEEFPQFKPLNLDLNDINKQYLYAQTCLDCEPSIPELSKDHIFLKLFIEALEKNRNYTALVVIEDGSMFELVKDNVRLVSSRRYAGEVRRRFTSENKIENKRVKIKFTTQINLGTTAYFYIVPKIVKNKENN